MSEKKINWRQDRITRQYVKDHGYLEGDLTDIDANELGEAATYCRDWNNPFIKEILKRSGHYKDWQTAANDMEKRRILDKSCAKQGFRLF